MISGRISKLVSKVASFFGRKPKTQERHISELPNPPAFAPPRHVPFGTIRGQAHRRADAKRGQRLQRRALRRKLARLSHLLPPPSGQRRAEFSSSVPGQWMRALMLILALLLPSLASAQSQVNLKPTLLTISSVVVSERFSEGALIRPASTEARCKSALADSNETTPISSGHGFTVMCEQAVSSSVVGLFGASGPFAVVFTIGAIVVDAFNSEFSMRPTSHIREKVTEAISPSVADSNAASAISGESGLFGVVAAVNNTAPQDQLSGSSSPSLLSVPEIQNGYSLSVQTAATFSISAPERPNISLFFDSTGTLHDQKPVTVDSRADSDNGESAENVTNPSSRLQTHNDIIQQNSLIRRSEFWSVVIGNFSDLASTELALRDPRLREGNPIMGQHRAQRIVLKAAGTAAQVWIVGKIGKEHPKLAKCVGFSAGAFFGGVTVWNSSR